jgi:hypothetical protein
VCNAIPHQNLFRSTINVWFSIEFPSSVRIFGGITTLHCSAIFFKKPTSMVFISCYLITLSTAYLCSCVQKYSVIWDTVGKRHCIHKDKNLCWLIARPVSSITSRLLASTRMISTSSSYEMRHKRSSCMKLLITSFSAVTKP